MFDGLWVTLRHVSGRGDQVTARAKRGTNHYGVRHQVGCWASPFLLNFGYVLLLLFFVAPALLDWLDLLRVANSALKSFTYSDSPPPSPVYSAVLSAFLVYAAVRLVTTPESSAVSCSIMANYCLIYMEFFTPLKLLYSP